MKRILSLLLIEKFMDKEPVFDPKNKNSLKESPDEFLIWWLTYEEIEKFTREQWLILPIYIKKALRSFDVRIRWVQWWIPEGIAWDKQCPDTERFEQAGGIVFSAGDKETLATLPGLVTDLKMNTQSLWWEKVKCKLTTIIKDNK